VDALIDKVDELGEDLRSSARRLILKHTAPGLIKGALYGLAGKALMHYLDSRAVPVEGNGAGPSSEREWSNPQRATSAPAVS
jgi:hypothetical protein